MNVKTIITKRGIELINTAVQSNDKVKLSTYALGYGASVTDDMTSISNVVREGSVNHIQTTDNQIMCEVIVEGGDGEVNQLGIFDASGNLIIVSDYPTTQLSDAVSTRVVIAVNTSNADNITVVVDPHTTLATMQHVIDHADETEKRLSATLDDKVSAAITSHESIVAGEEKGHVSLTDDYNEIGEGVATSPQALRNLEKDLRVPATDGGAGPIIVGTGLSVTDKGLVSVKTASKEEIDEGVSDDVYVTPDTLDYRLNHLTQKEVETEEDSTAIGVGSTAKGKGSLAAGDRTNASGNSAISLGRENSVNANEGISIGTHNTVTSYGGVTLGSANISRGKATIAAGEGNIAGGRRTILAGYKNESKKDDAYIFGAENTAYADKVVMVGSNNKAFAAESFTVGEGCQSEIGATGSMAMGRYCKTSAPGAIALGYYSEAKGKQSLALGQRTVSDGDYALTAGYKVDVKGDYAVAYGEDVTGDGVHTDARGQDIIVRGEHSIAQGINLRILADYANAIGKGLSTKTRYTHLIGRWNEVKGDVINEMPTEESDVWAIGNGMNDGERNTVARIQNDGQMFIDGRYRNKGADYAEMFEWSDGNVDGEDRTGLAVSIAADGKIKIADAGDDVIGIISAAPSIVGNDPDKWQGKYVTDVFGRVVWEDTKEGRKPKINPLYEQEKSYIPRSKRKEWGMVGLLGQIPVYDDGTCEVGGRAVVSSEGVMTKSEEGEGYIVLDRLAENVVLVLYK